MLTCLKQAHKRLFILSILFDYEKESRYLIVKTFFKLLTPFSLTTQQKVNLLLEHAKKNYFVSENKSLYGNTLSAYSQKGQSAPLWIIFSINTFLLKYLNYVPNKHFECLSFAMTLIKRFPLVDDFEKFEILCNKYSDFTKIHRLLILIDSEKRKHELYRFNLKNLLDDATTEQKIIACIKDKRKGIDFHELTFTIEYNLTAFSFNKVLDAINNSKQLVKVNNLVSIVQ